MTAISKKEKYIHEGYSLGAVDYILKPFEPWLLRSKVATYVDLFRKTRELQGAYDKLRETGHALEKTNASLQRMNVTLEQRVAERTTALKWSEETAAQLR